MYMQKECTGQGLLSLFSGIIPLIIPSMSLIFGQLMPCFGDMKFIFFG